MIENHDRQNPLVFFFFTRFICGHISWAQRKILFPFWRVSMGYPLCCGMKVDMTRVVYG